MKLRLDQYNNSWYQPGPAWRRGLWMLVSALFFNHPLAVGSSFKCRLLRLFGAKVGSGVIIKPSVNIKYPWFLSVGHHCWIGEKVWIDNLAQVTINDHVCLSQGCFLLTGNHDFTKPTFDLLVKPIVLEDGVWIGAKAVVCPGVVVQSHAVLAVQSVATKNLVPYTIYQGNPAQPVRERVQAVSIA